MKTYKDSLRRYGFALITLALTQAAMAIPEIRDGAGTPILVYFFAVLLSACYGGLGPGLLTTAAIALMTSHTSFPFWRIVRLGLGIASGISISALAEVLHAARRRAERNEQRFRALIEKGWDVISVISADGVVLYASPTVTHTLGHAPEDFVGRPGLEPIHPDDRERVSRLFDELRGEPGASRGMEYRIRDKQGTWRWLEGTVTNLLTDAAVGGMVCNFRDVTGRKRAEEALARARCATGCCSSEPVRGAAVRRGRPNPRLQRIICPYARVRLARGGPQLKRVGPLLPPRRPRRGPGPPSGADGALPTSRSAPAAKTVARPGYWAASSTWRAQEARPSTRRPSSTSPSGSGRRRPNGSWPKRARCSRRCTTTRPRSTPWPAWRCRPWLTSA